MKKVCVDTNMLVWYIKRQCTKGQEDYLVKADYLFSYFERNNILVVIPSLAVAELLGAVKDEDEREEYFDYMSLNFEIAQHDILSARKYANLGVQLTEKNALSYAKSNGIPRCQITNDYNICSVALSSGCDAIFSHNLKHFEKFANHEIPIYTLDYVDVLIAEEEAEKSTKKPLKDTSQFSLLNDLINETNDDDEDDYEEIQVIP